MKWQSSIQLKLEPAKCRHFVGIYIQLRSRLNRTYYDSAVICKNQTDIIWKFFQNQLINIFSVNSVCPTTLIYCKTSLPCWKEYLAKKRNTNFSRTSNLHLPQTTYRPTSYMWSKNRGSWACLQRGFVGIGERFLKNGI